MLGIGPFGPRGPLRAPVPVGGPAPAPRGEATLPAAPRGAVTRPSRGVSRDGHDGRPPKKAGTGTLAEERQAWVLLATVDGVGERTLERLVRTHGSARRVLWLAGRGRLQRRLMSDVDARPASLPAPVLAGIERVARDRGAILAVLRDAGVWTLTLLDPDYPRRLDGLPTPPPVLFGQGDAALLREPRTVAIVGTRRASPVGRVDASRAAAALAASGVVVVSGLAVGIDGAAHAACVEAGGPTLAVIGSGHLRPGPRAHSALVRRILERGAVVGELAPAARATRGTYPRRNRIIAALGDAVLVVEAPERSGALITAHLAMESGVPVYALPGRMGSELSAGCRALLSEGGALPYEGVAALFGDLGWHWAGGGEASAHAGRVAGSGPAASAPSRHASPQVVLPASGFGPNRVDAIAALTLSDMESELCRVLADGPVALDGLLAAGASPGETAAALTLLQLRGLVRTVGGLYLPAGPLLLGPP